MSLNPFYQDIVTSITKSLTEFLPYNKAQKLRNTLKTIYVNHYTPDHKPRVYFDFIKKNIDFSCKEVHPQATNFPYVYEVFTVRTQHIYGNSLEHILDTILKDK